MRRELPGKLDALMIFAAVADAGGFTAAAERLGLSKAAVSLHLRRLETQLGVALFTRTTRRVRLTSAGEALYRDSAPALAALGEALAGIGRGEGELSGTIRLTAPVDHAMQSVTPALARFAERHPQLHFDLRTSDRVIDLVAEGIDLAIRLGALRDSSLRAIKLGSFEQQVVASPDYLRRRGVPATPDELADHQWVGFSLMRTPLTWTFARGDESRTVRLKTRIQVDSSASLRALLAHGSGLSVLDQFSITDALRDGRLVRVLADWSLPRGGVYAVLPPGQHVPARVRAFIDFYRDYVAARAETPGHPA